jgi:EAL domain-containing protein (putative c-di-GMP-specific phosphodiesterase class I)
MPDDATPDRVLHQPACACHDRVPVQAGGVWRAAIERGMQCWYQPIVDRTGQVVAFEALLRAGDPDAPVPPAELFAAAQAEGWSTWLDQAARRTAIEGSAAWLGTRTLFVNFLPSSIYDPARCLATTREAARRAEVSLRQLVFEVVETEAIRDVPHLAAVFAEYKRMGCRVALDDVGSGRSTVELVRELQPDVVKIDRGLVRGLPSGETRRAFEAIVDAGTEVGACVLAEGVETGEELAAVRAAGAEFTQGWLHGRPVPADALATRAAA